MSADLFWLILTLGIFQTGLFYYEKRNKPMLLQPIFVTYIAVLTLLMLTGTSYTTYFQSTQLIHFLLAPATVALALPLYKNFALIRALFVPVMITLVVGSTVSILVAVGLLYLFGASPETMISMTTKSITAAIAAVTSKQIGAIPSLAIGFVILTGMTGAVFGTLVLKLANIKHDEAKGFALGIISHGIGTARAVEISEKAGAFSALAMGLGGILVSILLPVVIALLD